MTLINAESIPFTDTPDSVVLDPEFTAELRAMSKNYDDNQSNADDDQWNIARKVNEMWQEHKNLTHEVIEDDERVIKKIFPSKTEYYMECSRVANIGLKIKRFSDSGETLRRWCEVVGTYETFVGRVDDGEKFLLLLSFDHLYKAKTLYLNSKVKSPFDALIKAVQEKYTADEMQYHFDPPLPPDEYKDMLGRLDVLQDKSKWSWLKNPQVIKDILFHAAEIRRLIAEDK